MRSSRTSPHGSAMGWNASLTQSSPTLKRGFGCTIPINTTPSQEPGARPLYYAALCGFHELAEHLTLKYPHCSSARGRRRGTALHSASFAGHLQVVLSLLRHGVDVDIRTCEDRTPLLVASQSGHHDVVQCLIDNGTDVNSQEDDHNLR